MDESQLHEAPGSTLQMKYEYLTMAFFGNSSLKTKMKSIHNPLWFGCIVQ